MANYSFNYHLPYILTETFYQDVNCNNIINSSITKGWCELKDSNIKSCCNRLAEALNITLNKCDNYIDYSCTTSYNDKEVVSVLSVLGICFIVVISLFLLQTIYFCVKEKIMREYNIRQLYLPVNN